MTIRTFRPVANGLGTDHPIPDLPFVDDRSLPSDPDAIEAIGRNTGTDRWGRQDQITEGGWVAFTTTAERDDLAWFVRYHPVHGRSVMLMRDQDASSLHHTFTYDVPTALVIRAGGYWFDGARWFRPAQIWDPARERYIARPVPGAATVSAADVLDPGADASRGRLLSVEEFDPDAPAGSAWADDLALWAQQRTASLPLDECVVRLTAPELTGDQLIGAGELAEIAGIAASTLRAYNVRGEGEIPEPQAVIGGRNAWARPVGTEWAEQRKKSWDSATDAVSVDHSGISLPAGKSQLWTRLSAIVFSRLWTNAGMRQRWALRYRNEKQVRQIAEDIGWTVAGSLGSIVPIEELTFTIQHAVLDEFAYEMAGNLERGEPGPTQDWEYFGINFRIAKMLDWLVRHEPGYARAAIGSIIGDAERRFEDVPRAVFVNSIQTALSLDSTLDDDARREFLDSALPADE